MKNICAATLAVCLGTLGSMALQAQSFNTADGNGALGNNTTGSEDSAFGYDALYSNTSGAVNTATGFYALYSNTSGGGNTAIGDEALYANTTGGYNTAVGSGALFFNTSGWNNTATGNSALVYNTTGMYNVATGSRSLASNSTGGGNTAMGEAALYYNDTGSNNIAIGYSAGLYNAAEASNNIDIGNYGSPNDSGVLRIGAQGSQTSFYAAGIDGVGVSGGVPVYISSNGQLGTVNSSIRYKEDVHDMADASSAIFRLRPVTYRYKQAYADGSKPIDYGLIAEEVAAVYPDLVVKGTDGQIQTVQYQKLTPMLLNEVQKQHRLLEEQQAKIQQLERELAALPLLERRLAVLEAAQPSPVRLDARLETK